MKNPFIQNVLTVTNSDDLLSLREKMLSGEITKEDIQKVKGLGVKQFRSLLTVLDLEEKVSFVEIETEEKEETPENPSETAIEKPAESKRGRKPSIVAA